jgi:hypothetical protein
MKKILFSSLIALGAMFQANAQCTVDTSQIPAGQFISPAQLPCVERGVAYSEVAQFKIPTTINAQDFGAPIAFILTIDSIVITGFTGLPNGMSATYTPSSGVFYGGAGGCFNVTGTTSDPVGNYPVDVQGFMSARGTPFPPIFDGDTTIDLSSLNGLGASPFSALALDVINTGDQCRPSSVGIKDVKSFNAVINTFPNPAINVLNVNINTVERINGDVMVYDVMGRKTFIEKIDLIGNQNIAIDVTPFAAGIYTLVVTDGNKKFSSQFSVK